MTNPEPTTWEDDDYSYISQELFEHLPPEFRNAVEERHKQGADVLQIADQDIRSLMRLCNAIPTTSSLSYIFHRLRVAKFDMTSSESLMEQEMLTTAFVVTYSRLFGKGHGCSGVSREQIPANLQSVHDEILEIRHQRYAHNGGHKSIDNGVRIDFDGTQFYIHMQMSLGFYVGGRDEWGELVTFLDAHMHERCYKIIERLKEKTGYEWTFPVGPTPLWVGKYN